MKDKPILNAIQEFAYNISPYIKLAGEYKIAIELPGVGEFERLLSEAGGPNDYANHYNHNTGKLTIYTSSGILVEVSSKEYNDRYRAYLLKDLLLKL